MTFSIKNYFIFWAIISNALFFRLLLCCSLCICKRSASAVYLMLNKALFIAFLCLCSLSSSAWISSAVLVSCPFTIGFLSNNGGRVAFFFRSYHLRAVFFCSAMLRAVAFCSVRVLIAFDSSGRVGSSISLISPLAVWYAVNSSPAVVRVSVFFLSFMYQMTAFFMFCNVAGCSTLSRISAVVLSALLLLL